MVNLSLLSGKPFTINNIKVYPLLLEEIEILGEEKYNRIIGTCTMTKKQLQESLNDENFKDLSLFEMIFLLCYHDQMFREMFFESMKTFIRSDLYIDNYGIFIKVEIEGEIHDTYIEEKTFYQIQDVIREQNFLQKSKETHSNPANSKAAELLEKMKKVKEKIQKEKNENNLSLGDIISIVACYSNDINILNIWKLTVYQLYTAYLRLIMWDDYQSKQALLPHVSDTKSLDLEHWATSINKKLNKK